MTPLGSYGWAYHLPIPKVHDAHSKTYSNIQKQVGLNWATNTLKVELISTSPAETSANSFKSNIGRDYYGASTDTYNAV